MKTSEIFAAPGILSNTEFRNVGETVNVLGSVSGATTIDMRLGNVVTATATNAVTWTITNPFSSGKACTVTLILTNGGVGTQTWPTGTVWPGGNEPFLTASGFDIVVLMTIDAGTTWMASCNARYS